MKSIFVIRDAKAEAYLMPFYTDTKGTALRSVADAVNRAQENSPLAAHPEDFAMFHLGSYDEAAGKMLLLASPEHIVNLIDLKESGK